MNPDGDGVPVQDGGVASFLGEDVASFPDGVAVPLQDEASDPFPLHPDELLVFLYTSRYSKDIILFRWIHIYRLNILFIKQYNSLFDVLLDKMDMCVVHVVMPKSTFYSTQFLKLSFPFATNNSNSLFVNN